MKKVVLVMVLALVALSSLAQSAPDDSTPPPMLVVFQSHVKPGQEGNFETASVAWTSALRKHGISSLGFSMQGIWGNPEFWNISGFNSYGQMQIAMENTAAAPNLRTAGEAFSKISRTAVSDYSAVPALYRPELSYQPNFHFGDVRYVFVGITTINFGFRREFAEREKILTAIRQRVNSSLHVWMYELDTGANTRYMWILPMKSLADIDGWITEDKQFSPTDDETKRLREITRTAISSEQTYLFAVNPSASMPTKEMTERAPDFWNPKPAIAKKATAPATPAAKKEPQSAEKK